MRGNQQKSDGDSKTGSRKPGFKIAVPLIAAVVLLSMATLGRTLAYILTDSPSLTNTFVPAQMSCEIKEDFTNGINKKNVCVKNTSDVSAYIRVKLLPYWYDKEENIIVAKSAWEPEFSPESGWTLGTDGYYYYTSPVSPGGCTSDLIPSLELKQDDVSLARQVLEIIASCIQAEPAEAVMAAWSGPNGSVTNVDSNTLVIVQEG